MSIWQKRQSEQSLHSLFFQFERAVHVYHTTHSRYARLRARELISEMRDGLNDVDQMLAERAGLVERYRDQEVAR